MIFDTICAVSTPLGEGAIAVIRLSGETVFNVVNMFFTNKKFKSAKSHTIHYGQWINYQNEEFIDEVVVAIYRKPYSYTGENMVEINCHGGIAVVKSIMNLLLENKVRIADPGEFTKRAFLNNKMDLTKAESIMDIIKAQSEGARKVAAQGLSGQVSILIKKLKSSLLNIISNIEVNINYPEYEDTASLTNNTIKPHLFTLLKQVDVILDKSIAGRRLKEGIQTAIIGRTNVGKSSLLNTLLDKDKAIVTEIDGTTTDVVEGMLSIEGIQINLMDTAGIRTTSNKIEQLGISRSYEVIKKADIIILVLNYADTLSEEDKNILKMIQGRPHLVVINKVDLKKKLNYSYGPNTLMVSTKTNVGIQTLKQNILKKAGVASYDANTVYLSNLRHIQTLKAARKCIREALVAIDNNLTIDIFSIDLQNALSHLNEILGITSKTELIDYLFANFCLGK